MNLQEFQRIILDTAPDDWTSISCWGGGAGPSYLNRFEVWKTGRDDFSSMDVDSHSEVLSLKSNLLISVASGMTHNDDFIEMWANKFADHKASSGFVDFFYSGVLVYRDIYVSVDGGKCRLPLPTQHLNETYQVERLTVPKDKAHFFRLLNGEDSSSYEYYLERSGIEVVESGWMS